MTKEARICNGENLFSNKQCWENWTATSKKMKLEHSLKAYTKKLKTYQRPKCAIPSSFSHFQLFATPQTVAHQPPLSVGFSRQEYWSGIPFPSPGGTSQCSDRTQVSCIAGRFFTISATREASNVRRPKCKMGYYRSPRGKHSQNTL